MSKPNGNSVKDSSHPHKAGTSALVLGATGVVFGDIGTSPIYAMKQTFIISGAEPDQIFGIASMIFWALMLVVSLKYLTFVMRADNRGEGGMLALLSLMPEHIRSPKSRKHFAVLILVLIGTSLLFGDGVLTPAISVLSATEGLALLDPDLDVVAVPATVVILSILFAIQSRGTNKIGKVFGPVTFVWFTLIGGLGVYRVLEYPDVLKALSPTYAIQYFVTHGFHSVIVLAAVILVVTGAEALYTDMGHFGAKSIRIAWTIIVGPALVLSYLGQASVLMTNPSAISNPFFALAPNKPMTLVLIIVATAATIVASQALITGVFSLSRQAVQLGLFPRLTIRHTNADQEGQIYVPIANWLVGIGSISLVIAFKSSSALASAYVLAIAGTMAVTTVAFTIVARQIWHWPLWKIAPLTTIFLSLDLAFLFGTASRFFDGGWVPVVLGAVILSVMLIWRAGNRALNRKMRESSRTWQEIYAGCESGEIAMVPGIGIFMASPAEVVPAALISHVTIMHSLPESVYVVTIKSDTQPVSTTPVLVDHITDRLTQVTIFAGYMETVNVPSILQREALSADEEKSATYYLSERHFLASEGGNLGNRTETLFEILHRNAVSPTTFYGLPYDRVITIGTRIDL
ncbi:MAG: potassium transporter Kup [Candidatus Nanopelagicales bacterium]